MHTMKGIQMELIDLPGDILVKTELPKWKNWNWTLTHGSMATYSGSSGGFTLVDSQ